MFIENLATERCSNIKMRPIRAYLGSLLFTEVLALDNIDLAKAAAAAFGSVILIFLLGVCCLCIRKILLTRNAEVDSVPLHSAGRNIIKPSRLPTETLFYNATL